MRLGPTTLKILRLLSTCPRSAREVMNAIRPVGCSINWGGAYFLPETSVANGHRCSLRRRGLIEARGKNEKGATIWGLTPKGAMHAPLYHMELDGKFLHRQVQCNPTRRSV
jgi:hypothetical protein